MMYFARVLNKMNVLTNIAEGQSGSMKLQFSQPFPTISPTPHLNAHLRFDIKVSPCPWFPVLKDATVAKINKFTAWCLSLSFG